MAFKKDRLGDRRSDLRFEIIGQLWGALEVPERLPLRNVGRGGVLVESRVPLNGDSLHSVRLKIDGRADDVDVRVCHVTPVRDDSGERFLIGLEFVEPALRVVEQLDRMVAAAMGQSSVPEA